MYVYFPATHLTVHVNIYIALINVSSSLYCVLTTHTLMMGWPASDLCHLASGAMLSVHSTPALLC